MTGAEFRRLRIQAGKTSAQVAQFVGTKKQNIYTFEEGKVRRPLWDMPAAAKWLGAIHYAHRGEFLDDIEAKLKRAQSYAQRKHIEFNPFVVIQAERLALEVQI